MGGVVGGEGARVDDDGAGGRGETVGEDAGVPRAVGGARGGAVYGGRGVRGACGGRELGEGGEGAYGPETEVVLHARAEAGEVGECAGEIVGLAAVGDGGVAARVEGGELVVRVGLHGGGGGAGRGGYFIFAGGRVRN